MPDRDLLRDGALNLLHGCAGAKRGETLLILREDPVLGYFGEGLAEMIADHARDLGLIVKTRQVPFSADVETLSPDLAAEVGGSDHTLFLARLGDQLRFRDMPAGTKPVVSYILDLDALASPFGSAPCEAFADLKTAFNRLFAGARDIRVTCALGTDFRGSVPAPSAESEDAKVDVSIKRHPVSVFAPLEAVRFNGRVAVAHLLVGTGSRYYEPYGMELNSVLFAEIAGGRIRNWDGPADEVARARAHYRHVAERFGIDGDVVHSWHAGIHPGCAYASPAAVNYERWSGSAFGNPRLLHFHTCGDYAPGEICWNVIDPTIEVDGATVWKDGRIDLASVPGADAILTRHPAVARLFEQPSAQIGIGQATW
jgi:hypothetical protein